MSFKDQVINLIIQGRDLFSSEAKKSEKALGELASQSEILNNRLTELQNQQNSIRRIEELTGAIKKGEQSYKDSSVALDKLVSAQKAAAAEAKQLEQSQKSGTAELAKLQAQQAESTGQLARYESQIAQARAEVERLSNSQSLGATSGKAQSAALAKATKELAGLEQAQRETSQAASQLSSEIAQQENELRETGVAAERAGQTKAEYALKVKAARGELTQLGSTLNKNQNEYRQHEASLRSAGVSMDKLADASRDLKQQQSAAEIAISGVNEKLVRHERLLEQSSKQAGDFKGSIVSATSSLLAMAGAYIGIDRLRDSIVSVLSTGDSAASFSAQMTAMMGSIERGEQATAWIKDFANQTGTRLDSARQAFASLKTFGIDPMSGSLQSLTDYSAKLGGGQERLNGIILGVGQAWAKQKLQGEEILQLVERGVPVWDLLASVTGKNVVELQKLSESGQLGRETIKALFEEMGKQANGQASTSLNRLSGQINLISNNWESFKQKIADSGAYQVAVDFLKDLNAKFDELNANGRLKQAAEDISAFFTSIIRDGGSGLKTSLENISAFTRSVQVIAGSIRLVFNGISAGVSLLGAAVTQYFSNMALGLSVFIDALGGDKIAASLRNTGEMLQAVSQAYKAQIEQDGADIRAAWKQVTGEVAESSEGSYKRASDAAEKSADAQVESIRTVADAEAERAAAAEELSLLISKSGIVTVKSLQDQEEAAKRVYDAIDEQYKKGTLTAFEVKQAYEKWAESSLKLAAAQGAAVPETLKVEAAAKGLTSTLNGLVDQNTDLTASQQSSSQFQAQYITRINETSQSIEKLKATLSSTTASVKEKSAAQQQLTEKQKALKEQTEELNKVKLLEAQTYGELVQEYRSTQDELDRLNEMYKRGAIAAYEYIEAKERLEQRLSVVSKLIGDFEKSQKSSGEQVDKSNISLREQKDRMDALANSTGRATRFTSLFGEANNYLRQEFDLTGKSNEELTSRIQVLDEKIQQAGATFGAFWRTLAKQFEEGFNRERAIIGATLQFRKLTEELENSTVSLDRLNKISYIANYTLGDLDKSSLDNLKQSIDAARGRVQALGDELSGTVSNLRRELLQLKGETEKVEAEDFRARNEELTKKLREAEKTGDNEAISKAREALDLARQIAQEKQKQRAEDERGSKAQAAANSSAAAKATDLPQPVNRPSILTVSNASIPTQVQNNNSDLPTLLVLQVGNQKFNTSIDRDVLAQLVASIKQQVSVGG
jgi:tape measure domain-containing protein